MINLIKITWRDHLPIDGSTVELLLAFFGPWFFQDTILGLLVLWLCQVHPTDCTLGMGVRFWRFKSHWVSQDPCKNFPVLDTVPVRDLMKRQETAEWQWEKRFEWNCDENGPSLPSAAPAQFPRFALIQDQVRPMFSHEQCRSYLRHGTNQVGRSDKLAGLAKNE